MLKKSATEEQVVLHLTPEQEKDKSHFVDKETGTELEMAESCPLLEWLANNYKNFGATLEIITDRSQEGSQYVKGFGGIGGNHSLSSMRGVPANEISSDLNHLFYAAVYLNRRTRFVFNVVAFISGILRYRVDFQSLEANELDDDEFDLDDF